MKNINGLIISESKRFIKDDGDIFHGIRKTDIGYADFGEVYFSFIKNNSIKGWKMHTEMTLNIIVPIGSILFNFIDLREKSESYQTQIKLLLGDDNYQRVTVPPRIIFAFKGMGMGKNMLANITNMPHDDAECQNLELNKYSFIE